MDPLPGLHLVGVGREKFCGLPALEHDFEHGVIGGEFLEMLLVRRYMPLLGAVDLDVGVGLGQLLDALAEGCL